MTVKQDLDLRQAYKATTTIQGQTFDYYSLAKAAQIHDPCLAQLPITLKVLLENCLRHLHTDHVVAADIDAFADWVKTGSSQHEIAYHPARVLMQDFTGVPAVVDLAAMRDAMVALGGDPNAINPQCPVDLVIDHSVQVDQAGTAKAFVHNVQTEMLRNRERYKFLKWGADAFRQFRVVPPGTGICHQVNLEHLASVVCTSTQSDANVLYPDTLVGTDSHTTMVGGLAVLGWGVGGIEAEAAMLGQPVSILIPDVIGVAIEGEVQEGVTATDIVLAMTERLRAYGVVGKFVEYFGAGLSRLSLADRATLANMAPEYGATCGFSPIDAETLRYMALTGRDQAQLQRVEAYAKMQGMWADDTPCRYTDVITFDLSDVVPALAGPKRPQDRVALGAVPQSIATHAGCDALLPQREGHTMLDGDVVIAAITSCTNTSNPNVLIAAGLLAKAAVEKGLVQKPWVKCSLAPGSKVVMDYLQKLDLLRPLEQLGFHLVGFGCTTCIGNSGPLSPEVTAQIEQKNLYVCGVLSGNRNFEGRIHPLVQSNWLASPPLVVAYALAGSTRIDLTTEPLGIDQQGQPVYLTDIWPTSSAIDAAAASLNAEMFATQYADVFSGDAIWQKLPTTHSETYAWHEDSTYVRCPSFFEGMTETPQAKQDIHSGRILAILGDSVTTDHISPAGQIKADSPAGQYLQSHGVQPSDFNSYGSRRGNHEVMMRGTFANIRIRNRMVPGLEGGFTKHIPSGDTLSIYDAAMAYQDSATPLVVFAGKEYGTGSSRDWAAKGTYLLGVQCVIAESFERIHRSNLIGMGVLPCELKTGTLADLQLVGDELVHVHGIENIRQASAEVTLTLVRASGQTDTYPLRVRIDTQNELHYYQHGGILHYVLRQLCRKH